MNTVLQIIPPFVGTSQDFAEFFLVKSFVGLVALIAVVAAVVWIIGKADDK